MLGGRWSTAELMGTARRKTWLLVLLAIIVLASVIAVALLNRPKANIAEVEADFSLSAAELIDAFAENETEADRLYGGKVLEVEGTVKRVITDENAPILVMGDTSRDISISCYLQTETPQQYGGLQPGDVVKVKGVCNGMLMDIMLDRTILLTR